jgi:putative methionine-R-sulfoxide reductase with GAF domain
VTDQNKPKLDEQIFAKLLEAAYVLQEHNREMREIEESLEMHTEFLRQQEAEAQTALQKSAQRADQRPRNTADYTLTLAEIVEAQHQIQIRHLQSDQAMDVVADRIARITNASGAGVAIQDGKLVRYRAGAGTAALPVGTGVPLDTAICAICVRTGQVLRTPDVDTEFLFDPELCRQRGIYSLVAVPVYHDGNIVGALELYFDRVQGFVEQDIHTCQLMAGLVTEAIGRSSQSALKNSMAEELSSMLATIEKLQPTLAAGEPEQNLVAVNQIPRAPAEEAPPCWKCGSKVGAEDQFCGKCGAPRLGERDRSSVQKLTSTWSVPSASSGAPNGPADRTAPRMLSTSEAPPASPAKQEIAPRAGAGSSPTEETETWPPASTVAAINERMLEEVEPDGLRSDEAAIEKSPSALTKATPSDATWSSAAKARDFLDGLAQSRSSSALVRFWHVRRGHIYLAVALIAVLMVIWWGVMSSHSVGATGATSVSTNGSRRKAATDADLSTWDKILINLGVAEAPSQAPELKGNPDTQVWIDLHTALYYCPGSDLYGKTPNGRFTSQREAQLDQFESASRRACD